MRCGGEVNRARKIVAYHAARQVPDITEYILIDVPAEVQMAIRLRAVKSGVTTGDVVSEAVRAVFGKDVEEAKKVLSEEHET